MTPTSVPNRVIVTDDLNHLEDLSYKYDVDTINDRKLVIRWDLDVDDIFEYHIYVKIFGDERAKFLSRTADSFLVWEPTNKEEDKNINLAFMDGPQFLNSYVFYIYIFETNGTRHGPYLSGPVIYLEEYWSFHRRSRTAGLNPTPLTRGGTNLN